MSSQTRPPVVTILGHVDHGKTTLLDFIRKSNVAAKEHGGITQATSAYQVEIPREAQDDPPRRITFIDTPGHAAFEKMRYRGARLADVAVLVVAVEDGVMPQTVEAIKHIQGVGIPMIVAVNKIDLPGVNVKVQMEKIKKQLSDQKILVEEYGGDVPIVQVSAKTGEGIPGLLETIILVSEMHEFKGDPAKPAFGIVIESKMDRFKGPVATILVRDGTLKKGDPLLAGGAKGKVRGLLDWEGKNMEQTGPSTPVEVSGFENVPPVGSELGKETEKEAQMEVKSLIDKLKQEGHDILNGVVKADKEGSMEAVEDILNKFNEGDRRIKIILKSTGEITDSDIDVAAATKAIVLGFNTGVASSAGKLAEANHVLVRTYKVIYELADEVKEVVEGILEKGALEEVFGRAQIIAEFPYGKGEKIAGCKVLEGVISKGPKIRIVRGDDPSLGSGQVIGEAKIKSLKKVKEEVAKVEKGMECGMMFEPGLDFKIGDLVESFRTL